MTSDPTPAAADLLAAARSGGPMPAVVELLRAWWGMDVPDTLTDELALLDWLRDPDVVGQLPWPQDEIVASSPQTVGAEELIARENESLWEAFLNRSETPPTVTFVVDDGARRVEPTMPLGEFLLRVLVEAAVYSGEQQVRCRVRDPERLRRHLVVDKQAIEPGLVSFLAVSAGAGWLGLMRGDVVYFATRVEASDLASALAGFGEEWEKLVGEPRRELRSNPWERWPAGTGQSWRPL